MSRGTSRRELLKALGASGLVAAGGSLGIPSGARAEPEGQSARSPATWVDGKVIQPRRELPVLHRTQVLVVGAGPAGVTAAIASSRTGAKTTIVERYGHFGGQWTGGLVLLLDGMYAAGNKLVTRGIGLEMVERLNKMDRALIGYGSSIKPTVDAEAVKHLMVEMAAESKIDVFLHSWGVEAIVDGAAVKGAVFESKSGRQAILADVVVDATGDGDIFASAGAAFELMRYKIGLVCRIGNLDKIDKAKAPRSRDPSRLGGPTPIPGVNWVNMQGPDGDATNVVELTRLELAHRRHIWKSVEAIRKTPGYEQVYLVETAPQLGVRMSRLLAGLTKITRQGFQENRRFSDVVGIGGAWNADHQEWQIPYGALVPRKVDNILAAGRCIYIEPKMADLVRVIPPCWVSGHAAGAAAALAVLDRCRPREVETPKLQKLLREQNAYLG